MLPNLLMKVRASVWNLQWICSLHLKPLFDSSHRGVQSHTATNPCPFRKKALWKLTLKSKKSCYHQSNYKVLCYHLSPLPPPKKNPYWFQPLKVIQVCATLMWPSKEPSIPPNGWKIGDEKMSSYFLEILQLCAATPHPGNLDQGPNTHLCKFNQSWPCIQLVGGGKHKRWRHWLGLVLCEHIIAAVFWEYAGDSQCACLLYYYRGAILSSVVRRCHGVMVLATVQQELREKKW